MIFVLCSFLAMAIFPLLVVFSFHSIVVAKKKRVVREDLPHYGTPSENTTQNVIQGPEDGGSPRRRTTDSIERDIDLYYRWSNVLYPASMLSFLYLICAYLCYAFTLAKYDTALPAATAMLGTRVIFNPVPSVWARSFAFSIANILLAAAGAYIFNVGTTIRRLYVIDLTEHVFWGSINRLLGAVGIALVLGTMAPDKVPRFVYFGIGFVVNLLMEYILRKISDLIGHEPKSQDLPLEMIGGIDLWKEYRLEEEGIENIQNLATADVKCLAIKTHYKLQTLVDWVDQAMLIFRLGEKVSILRAQGFTISAMDFALKSPKFTGSQSQVKTISGKLGLDEVVIAGMMDSLYENKNLRTLWSLAQRQPEGAFPKPGGRSIEVLQAPMAASASAGALQ
jgi:hypothetical protein